MSEPTLIGANLAATQSVMSECPRLSADRTVVGWARCSRSPGDRPRTAGTRSASGTGSRPENPPIAITAVFVDSSRSAAADDW